MKLIFRLMACSISIASSAVVHASCADWGLYAAHIAELRNGGSAEDAALKMMWNDALSMAQEGAANETSFAGFDPTRAKAVITSVYSSHHEPSY